MAVSPIKLHSEAPNRDRANPVALDSRRRRRATPAARARVWAVLPGEVRGHVRELAYWGARITVANEGELVVAKNIQFELRDENRVLAACEARIVSLTDYELGSEVVLWILTERDRWVEAVKRHGVVSLGTSQNEVRAVVTQLPAERVGRRLRSLTAQRSRARVRSCNGSVEGSLPARLDPERGLLMEWDPRWATIEGPFQIDVEGEFSTVSFVEDSLDWAPGNEPTEVTVTRRRQMRRVGAPSGARIILHGTAEESIELKMQDVSFGGVSAQLTDALDSLEAGTQVPEVVVTWKGGPGLRFVGDIRHRSSSPRRGDQMIGLQLSGAPAAQRARWEREVENLLYPLTKSFRHDYESIWDLFEASGYFDLSGDRRHSLGFQQLRSAFESAYHKLAAAPELGCMVSYESPTRVEATLAGLRVWSKSWFGLQMARNADRPHMANSDNVPLREIHYHVYERAGANTDLEWLVGYVRDDAGFSAALHRDFVLTVPGSCGVPFEAWRFGVSMRGSMESPKVTAATGRQKREVLTKLEELRPQSYLEAHDLEHETFDQEELQAEWNFHGLMRERTMLVATDRGRVVAAAVLDAVEEGLHLYGLLDTARLYELAPGGSDHFGSLLVAANEWFFGLGKNSFICFDENGRPDIMRSSGAQSLGKGMVTLLPRVATPDLLERISELTAPK